MDIAFNPKAATKVISRHESVNVPEVADMKPKLGLYQWVKNQFRRKSSASDSELDELVKPISRKASKLLGIGADTECPKNREKTPSSSSSRSSTLRLKRPRTISRNSERSLASSFRANKPLVPPKWSPMDEEPTWSESSQHVQPDISSVAGAAFLPSEATKIGTPPGSPRPGRNENGMFLDFRHGADNEPSSPWAPKTSKPKGNIDPVLGAEREWFRLNMTGVETELAESFDLNIPEHLPSSPLCPMHPKHASKGKGICVYHGRRRDSTDTVGK